MEVASRLAVLYGYPVLWSIFIDAPVITAAAPTTELPPVTVESSTASDEEPNDSKVIAIVVGVLIGIPLLLITCIIVRTLNPIDRFTKRIKKQKAKQDAKRHGKSKQRARNVKTPQSSSSKNSVAPLVDDTAMTPVQSVDTVTTDYEAYGDYYSNPQYEYYGEPQYDEYGNQIYAYNEENGYGYENADGTYNQQDGYYGNTGDAEYPDDNVGAMDDATDYGVMPTEDVIGEITIEPSTGGTTKAKKAKKGKKEKKKDNIDEEADGTEKQDDEESEKKDKKKKKKKKKEQDIQNVDDANIDVEAGENDGKKKKKKKKKKKNKATNDTNDAEEDVDVVEGNISI